MLIMELSIVLYGIVLWINICIAVGMIVSLLTSLSNGTAFVLFSIGTPLYIITLLFTNPLQHILLKNSLTDQESFLLLKGIVNSIISCSRSKSILIDAAVIKYSHCVKVSNMYIYDKFNTQ